MDRERWKRIKELFARSTELPGPERTAFLRRETASEPALLEEVLELLSADEDASRFLDGGPVEPIEGDRRSPGRWIGRRFGPYRSTRELGRGGMGVVVLAERADGRYHGEVAVKVVHTALLRNELAARFRAEGQILADLDHPNIARLHDAGETEDGLSYLIMEYVDGPRIDTYADEHRLGVRDRLDLFRTALDGVGYAHARGVIHRDLKPSNILVTSDGQAKLVDFGIAKLLQPAEDGGEALTRTSLRMMTPEYASPEQVRGLRVDPASDVYSMGVVLYRLLTGRAPYALPATEPHLAEQVICEQMPRRPSVAVTQPVGVADPETTRPMPDPEALASQRSSTREGLKRTLRGDLDAIVLTALGKEPRERYADAGAFGEDVARYLEKRPVQARAPGIPYRFRRFARRRPAVIALAGVMLGAGVTIAWQAGVAARERQSAANSDAELMELASSVISTLNMGQREEQGATATREAAVAAALASLNDLVDRIEGEPSPDLLYQLAGGYREVAMVQGYPFGANLGKLEEATANMEIAVRLTTEVVARDPDRAAGHSALGQQQSLLGDMYLVANRSDEALELYEESVRGLERRLADEPDDFRALDGLGVSYQRLANAYGTAGDLDRTLEYLQKARAADERYAAETPYDDKRAARQDLVGGRSNMAEVLSLLGRFDEGVTEQRGAVAAIDSLVAEESTPRGRQIQARMYGGLARLLVAAERFSDARPIANRAVAMAEAVTEEDPSNVQAVDGLAGELITRGLLHLSQERASDANQDLGRAVRLLRPSVAGRGGTVGPLFMNALRIHGDAQTDMREYPAAAESYEQALELGRVGMASWGGLTEKVVAFTYLSFAQYYAARAGPSSDRSTCRISTAMADTARTTWSRLESEGRLWPGDHIAWNQARSRRPTSCS